MTNAEARFSKSLRPRKPEGSLGRTAQDVHLDSHTAPELWRSRGHCLTPLWWPLAAVVWESMGARRLQALPTKGLFVRLRKVLVSRVTCKVSKHGAFNVHGNHKAN